MGESDNLKKNIDTFRLSAKRVAEKINNIGDIWNDNSYVALRKTMGDIAKASKSVIEHGDRTCGSTDKFFAIANEKI
jgi:hypothetical protein